MGARGAGATALCGLNNPIIELHAGGGPPRRATSSVAPGVLWGLVGAASAQRPQTGGVRSAQDSANRAPGGTGTAQRAQIGMMHIYPGDVRSPINLPATQGFDIYPQERPHQPHQPQWMPHGVDPRNHMPVRYMAEGPAAAPGSTGPAVDGQGRYEAPTLQQLQIWHHMNAERTPPASRGHGERALSVHYLCILVLVMTGSP